VAISPNKRSPFADAKMVAPYLGWGIDGGGKGR